MPDFSLVPVEHQPDFEDASHVAVDQDPSGFDGAVREPQVQQAQIQTQPVQTQSLQQQPAMGANQPNVGAPAFGDGPDPPSDQGKPVPASFGARTANLK